MRYDLIVVGAGPAGMTAALYGARAGKTVLLLEAAVAGGQILNSQRIENYPALPETDGYTFTENLYTQALTAGVTVEYGAVSGITQVAGGFSLTVGDQSFLGISVILATGLKHRHLGVPGEEPLIGRGISFCATCDGALYRGKEVAVVGGGNTAVQDALTLSELCSRVYLIHRRAELRAERGLVARMLAKQNVVFLESTVIREIRGEGRLSSLLLFNTVSGEERELFVDGLFEAIGQIPQNGVFEELVALDEDGYFLTDANMATSVEGVFAAGDACRKSIRQLTTAVADGTVAALSASAYVDAFLEKGDLQ